MTTADRAWELYLERGVVIPEYADEIAARRETMHEWATHGRPLR